MSKDSERGGAIFWMVMMSFLVTALALVMIGGNAYVVKAVARNKLENALLSAVVASKPSPTAIDATVARPYFNLYLQKNLGLNTDFTPTATSIASGTVLILDQPGNPGVSSYQALTQGATDPILGDTLDKASLEAIIEVPVKGGYTVRVFSRVAIN